MATATAKRAKRTTTAAPPMDPVTQYAHDVLTGVVVAGRAVRLACQRHLRDLDRQRTEAFPYYFDIGAAQHVIDFFPAFLTLENGDPFVLPRWLEFCYGNIFGWKVWGGDRTVSLPADHVRRAGKRKYIYGFFETSKGSGKTPSAGGIGLYGMTFDDEPYAEIYSAAFDREQASIILNDAIRMAEANDEFVVDEGLDVGKYNIANLKNGSFFRATSAEHRGKSGPRPHMVLGDEIHEHRDGRVVNKLIAGFKHRPQPLALLFTNSGSDKTTICWEYHQKSLAVLEGTQPDEQWFAYVCHLDPCDKCYANGSRQPNDGCEACDDWTNPAVWPKVAPALGIVIQPKYMQDAIDRALSIPSEYSMVRRLNFCIWTETHEIWIPFDRWDACKVPAVATSNDAGLACAAGLDPSSVLDLTAFVVAIRRQDKPGSQPAPEVEIEGMDEHRQRITATYTLNFTVEIVPYFWLPEQTLNERVRTERIPFDVWRRNGHLFVTPGPAIDHHAVYDFVLAAWKRFKIQRLGMDENGGRFLYMKLQQEGRLGDQVVSVGQGFRLSEAFKFIEMLVAHKRLIHDGHPVLAWNVANAEPDRHKRTGALAITKPNGGTAQSKRIDGAIAMAMAVHQLMTLPARSSSFQMFFVGGRK